MLYFYTVAVALLSAAWVLVHVFQLRVDIYLWEDLKQDFLHFYLLGLPMALIGCAYSFILFRYQLFQHLRYAHKAMVVAVVTYAAYFFLYTALQVIQFLFSFTLLPFDTLSVLILILLPVFYILFLYEAKPLGTIRRFVPITADMVVLTVLFLLLAVFIGLSFGLLGSNFTS